MKKAKIIGKKTLSVFLAVLMVLTAWVWVAPTEAEAANGSYYVKISWTCDDAGDDYDTAYTGKASGTDNNVGLSLYFKTNNGRGTEQEKAWDLKSDMAKKGSYTETGTISGFPTSLYVYNNHGGATDKGIFRVTKIEVGSSSSNLKTIWSGEIYMNSTWNPKYVTLTSEGKQKDSNDTSNAKVTTSTVNWVFPYVKSDAEISSTTAVADIGIPPLGDEKDTKISTNSIQYYATDYYGVRYEPTSYTVTGVSGLTTGTGWSCGNAYPITATTSTTKSTVGVSQTATVTMNWNNGTSQTGQKANTTATFKVYNPRYKVTFNGNGGTLGTGYTYGYYGRPINHSTSTATSNNVEGLTAELFPTTGIKEGYTFGGMYTAATGGSKISATQTVSADVTYYAHWNINQYTATFYGTRANDAGTDTVEYIIDTSTVDYNTNPVPPSTVDGYSLGDYDYTFKSWDKEISAIGVNGAEYRATYNSIFVPANYDAVNAIVSEANDIINGANYEGVYSEESRNALEAVVNSVNYNFGRTNQETVDGYVPLIRAAIDGLGRQKYSVLFIDAIDNSVIELRYPVYYGDAITMPEAPVRGFTSTDHYVFREWTTSETTDNINFVEKNMIIIANYDKVAHTYTDTELPSNCTTQAGVLHKCSCGYEYVEYAGSVGTEHNLETEWTIDIAPTCTTVGSKSRHCTRCSYRAEVTEIPALEHDFSYQGVVITPGCENDGAEVSECQRCGYDKYELLPSVGHNWTENVVAPTCTSSGYTVKTCSNCHDEDIVSFVDPIAHTYTEATDEYVAPTCTGLGKKVSYCSCGAQKVETISSTGHVWNTELTTDYESTCTTKGQQSIHCSVCDVINQESITEIPENGHTWGNEVCEQKETCGVKGLYVKTCTVCGEDRARITDALTHKYNTTTTPATCTEAGKKVTTCENCGDISNVEILQPLGHKYENAGAIVETAATCTSSAFKTYNCDNCDYTYKEIINGSNALLHDFKGTETIISDATCTADGQKTVKCTRCDVTNEVIIPKLGHSYGAWEVVKEATNNEDGKWKRVCANNAEHIEYITIPKGGHTWDNGTVTKTANCTTTGTMLYKCNAHANCGITLEVTIPVTQHSVAQRETPATCTKTGTVEAYCLVCNQVLSTEEIPVVPHTLNNGTAFAPTCTTSGYTLYECTANCGFSYKEYDASKPATGHTYTSAVTKDASCTEEGVKTFTCSCGASYTETIPATGHTYVKGTVTAANCTTAGTEVYTCSCGDTYTKFIEAAKGHTYTNWEVVTPATADKSGVQMGTCACGDVKYDVLAPIGNHTFTETVTKNPTCTEKGEKSFTCSAHTDCSANYTAEIPATGHTQIIVYTAPTCIAEGTSKIVCSVESCKAEIMSTSIPATGIHDFSGEGVITAPGCTTEGEITYICETDGCTATKKDKIPAKGHTFTTTVTDAKCGEKGSVVTECKVCNDPTVKTVTELAAKGHIWKDTPESTIDADCENNGSETYKCQKCEETNVVVIPALGHNWSDWTVTPSTNNDKGSVSRTCSVCNKVEKVDIPAGGHELVVDTDKSTAANCTTEGKTVYKCKNHADCGITITVDLPKLQHTIVQKIEEASCTEKGSVKAYCSVCDANCEKPFSTQEIPVKAHVYTAGTAVAPTCTTSGYTPYTCACGDTYNKYDASKPATGHTLVEGASTADCTTAGKMTLTCKNCTYTTTVDVPALGHNYVEDITAATEATCAAAATKTYKCSRCESNYTVSVGEKSAEHTWGAWQVKESATATSLGYKTRTCEVCGQIKVETIPATGEHNFNTETSRTEATCTVDGSVTYACSTHTNCGLTSTVTLPATGHTEAHDYKAATCTEAGYSRMVCSVESCKEVLAKTEIPALGHLYGEGTVTNATCKDTGKIEYTCTRTGCTATHETVIATNSNAHQYVTVVTDSTCTVKGSVVTKCALCGNVTTNKELPVIEHSWNSGEVKEGDAATCTTYGTKTFTCTVCSATKTETIAKLGHVWGEWTVTKASTNTEKGTLTRTCSRGCTETAEIPAGGHNLVETSRDDASCTKEGSVTYICDTEHTGGVDCGITVTVTLDKLQHELETTKTDATCDVPGTVITKCKNCDTATITTEIPATGHTYNDGVKTAATCTQTGKIVYTCTAKDCSKTKEVILDMLQHVYEPGEAVEPTCTSSGYTPYQCKTCDSSYVILGAEAKGHSFTEKVSSTATCIAGGTLTLKCADCDKTMETAVPALGHDYQLNSTTTATCAETATETYKCTRCSSNYTVSVGSKTENHDFGEWVTVEKADYDSIGYKTRTCKICDKLEVETIQATGEHKFTIRIDAESKAPTCTEDGYDVFQCSVHENCTEKSKVDLPKLGHTEELRYTAATCTKKGSTSIYCDVCKTTLDSEEIPALEHVWGSEEITQPTCSSKGSIKFTCTSCNTETKTVEIPVNTDAHKLTTSTEKAATCKEEGLLVTTCALCDYRTVTPLPMLQHSWGDWVKVDATNDTDGSWTRTCSNSCTETVVIPKGGHNLVEDAAAYRAPTCTDKGERVYKCTNHTNCSVKVTVTLEKVQHTLVTESETATCEKGGFVKVYCSNCDYKPVDMTIGKLAHKDKIVETKAATCTTAGYTTFECENCGRGFSRLDAQPTGHKYINDGAIVTTPATCETAGYTTYNCDNCDETHVVDIAAAKGHSWTEWTVEKAATNTEKGLLSRTCINGCGEKETAEIPAGGHSFDTKNPVSTTQGTCKTKGTKTFKCTAHTNCGIEITVETEFGSHAWSDWTKVDATNDEDGYWTRKCATCEEEETLIIPAGNHNLVEDTSKYVAPECNKQGQRVYRCTAHANCSVTITVVLERVQHTPKVDKKDATCTENGYVKTYCTACGELISEKELPLIAHNYDANGDGKVDKKDAVFEDGTYTYTCQAGCGHTITEDADDVYKVRFFDAEGNQIGEDQNVKFGESAVAPAAPEKEADGTYHYEFSAWDRNYGEITSDLDVYPTYEKELHYGGEATCKDKALCDKCGTPYGETDDSKHVIATKIKSATCEESGTITYYCSEGCGKATTVEEIKPMGHDFGEWEIYQAGNCAAPTIKIRKCRNYGCDKHDRWEIVNSHNWHIVKEIPPTCTAVGYSEYKYCLSCGTAVDSVKIPALGHRDNNGDGRCDYCTYVQNEVKCNCMCHSTGFMKFIYSIVRFFWRLTKSTPSCSCGARHY